MPKGQLRRVPWPGNSTFQPALWALQQLHKHYYSKLFTLNKHITTFNKLYQPFFCWFFFLSQRGFLQSTTRPHQSTARPPERAASHIKVACLLCLFRFVGSPLPECLLLRVQTWWDKQTWRAPTGNDIHDLPEAKKLVIKAVDWPDFKLGPYLNGGT